MQRSRFATYAPAGWLIFLALFGGASRYDEWQQVVVPIIAAGLLVTTLWTPDVADIRTKRVLWWFLGAVTAMMALQLVPLPPAMWTQLPGHEPFVTGARLAGLDHGWRPLSLTPDLTWASISWLLPVAATLAVAPTATSPAIRPLLWALLGIFVVATLLGLAQALGADGLVPFTHTNFGSATGFFANRNHHAIFLTLAFPVIGYLAATERAKINSTTINFTIGLGLAALFAVAIVQAGSRAGLVLGALMLGCVSTAIALQYFPLAKRTGRRRNPLIVRADGLSLAVIGVAVVVVIVALIPIVARSVAFDRLVKFDVTYDYRTMILPLLLDMARTFAPFGSGFGSFATVYRQVEPFDTLRLTYFNQAHNDVIQILIEGGVAGAGALAAAIAGWIWGTLRLVRAPATASRMVGIVGSLIVAALSLASLADYPLRTAFLAAVFVFAATFMLRSDAVVPGAQTE